MSAQLSKSLLESIQNKDISIPDEKYFHLPEKVLQFGTGVLLRGLPDYFIDKANKKDLYNGRIVVVKSTSTGSGDEFSKQDGLYTHCVKGFEEGKTIAEWHINASISRVLTAQHQWNEILEFAVDPNLELVISNTTEVGISYVEESIFNHPPKSFPAKLLAVLYQRFHHFKGDENKGLVIIPTELIPQNGTKLQKILIDLCNYNKLDISFIKWIQESCDICNSLVDRIVPGKLPVPQQQEAESLLGYKDDLLIMSETYRLWAIESNSPKTLNLLSFAKADKGVVIAPNINKFIELKLRLLNGSHTFTCGLAYLAGFPTVKAAMDNEGFCTFIEQLMKNEIIPSIVSEEISVEEAEEFANKVLDRFRNPFIDHLWINITMEYSSKIKMRCIPVLLKYYQKFNELPSFMLAGLAAHLQFMCVNELKEGKYFGSNQGVSYLINDSNASVYYSENENSDLDKIQNIFSNTSLWGVDLTTLKSLKPTLYENLKQIQTEGAQSILETIKI